MAAFVTLVYDPRNLMRLDWQLSYVCVLSMIVLAPPLYEMIIGAEKPGHPLLQNRKREQQEACGGHPSTTWSSQSAAWGSAWYDHPISFGRRFLNHFVILPVVVSTAIQHGLLPMQIAYFRQVNILIAISNIFGIFVASAATALAMATAALGWIPGVGAALGSVTNGLLVALGSMAGWFAGLPGTVLTLPALAPVFVALFYGLLLTGRWLRAGETADGRLDAGQRASLLRHFAAASCLIVAAFVWTPLFTPGSGGAVDLYMLDVGQGDALVLCAGGKTLVVDAGQKGRGRLVVEPFLRSMHIDRIDCLVATHADADHIGGMTDLIDHFAVGRFIEGGDTSPSETYAEMERELARRRVPVTRARAGDAIAGFGPARIRLLGPLAGFTDNNGSVVIEVDHGQINMLLMGDLEQPAEERLEEAGAIGDVEVLKVGHHGSKTATGAALLAKRNPSWPSSASGARNRFGPPVARDARSPRSRARANPAHRPARRDLAAQRWPTESTSTATAFRIDSAARMRRMERMSPHRTTAHSAQSIHAHDRSHAPTPRHRAGRLLPDAVGRPRAGNQNRRR